MSPVVRRRIPAVIAAACAMSSAAIAAGPVAVTWDADPFTPGVQDGPGTWDASLPNFLDPVTGTNDAFVNTVNHDVSFGSGGSGGLVTIGTSVTAHSLTFNAVASPYTIAANAGAALFLATTSPTITANADVTIAAPIVVPTPTEPRIILSKNGAGRLTLSGTNSWDGARVWFNINAGSVLATSPAALPGYQSIYAVRVYGTAGLYVPVGRSGQWTDATLGTLAVQTFTDGVSVFGIDTTAGDFTYTGSLSSGRNTKLGPNTLTLTGGGGKTFVVAEGSAVIASRPNGYADFTSVEVAPNASLVSGGGGTVTMTTIGLRSGSTMTVNGYTRVGTTNVVANAALAVNADAQLGNVTLAPDASLTIAPTATVTLRTLDSFSNAPPTLTATTPGSMVALTGGGKLVAPSAFTFAPVTDATYDLAALSGLTLIGGYAHTINGDRTVVKLPPTATLKADSFNVGRGTNVPTDVITPALLLGKTTTFDVGGILVGDVGDISSGGASGTIKLAHAAATGDAAVTIRNFGSTSGRAYVHLGTSSSPTKNQSATLDVRGAMLDATVATMLVGRYAPYSNIPGPATGSQTSSFAMSAGTLDASEIHVGLDTFNSSSLTTYGTNTAMFTQDGGTVRTGLLTLGVVVSNAFGRTAPAGTLVAVYNLGIASSEATLAAGAINAPVNGFFGSAPLTNLFTSRVIKFNNGRITTASATSDLTISGITHSSAALMTATNRNINIALAATGTHALTAPAGRTITLTDTAVITGSGGLLIDGAGSVSLNGSNTYAGGTVVTAGTLNVSPASRSPLLSGTGTDLRNGRVVFAYTDSASSPAETIRTLLAASIADNGFANATTLRSTTATAARGLGYADSGTAVTVMATLYGDLDLDGGVSINDFNTLASHFGQSTGQVWSNGDVDYDGGVSIDDFNLLAANFGQSLTGPAAAVDFSGLLAFAAAHDDLAAFEAVTGVPEPAAVGLLAGAVTLRRRRRA